MDQPYEHTEPKSVELPPEPPKNRHARRKEGATGQRPPRRVDRNRLVKAMLSGYSVSYGRAA